MYVDKDFRASWFIGFFAFWFLLLVCETKKTKKTKTQSCPALFTTLQTVAAPDPDLNPSGEYVRGISLGNMSGEYVRGISAGNMSGEYVRGICPGNMSGEYVRGICPGNMFQDKDFNIEQEFLFKIQISISIRKSRSRL